MCYPTFKMGNIKCRTLYHNDSRKSAEVRAILIYFVKKLHETTQRFIWCDYIFFNSPCFSVVFQLQECINSGPHYHLLKKI